MLSFLGIIALLTLTLVDGFWRLVGKLSLAGVLAFIAYQLITLLVGG